MKLTREKLNKLIQETIAETFEQQASNPVPDVVHHDLSVALSALRNASEGLRASGINATEVDDAYFKIKRYLEKL